MSKMLFAILALSVGVLIASVMFIISGPAKGQLNTNTPVMQSLNGTWKTSDKSDVVMTAVVHDNTITVTFGSKDDRSFSSLYWQGSFLYMAQPMENMVVLSYGDRNAMDSSLMGSQDTSKAFTYTEGKLTFPFTAMGVRRTVELEFQA